MFKKRSFLSTLAAVALLAVTMTASAPHSATAGDPGFGDGPPVYGPPPKPCTVWVNNGQAATVQVGESVCIRAESEPFTPVKAKPDDLTRLTDWLTGHRGASYADLLKFVQAEKLTIPQDVLARFQEVLKGTGVSPGPSSNPHVNGLTYMYSVLRAIYVPADHSQGACGVAVGPMGSGQNNTDYPGAVTVNVTGTVSNTASTTTGATTGFLSNQLGFSVTRSYSISTSYTASNVPRHGYVIIRGYKMGQCHDYHYYTQMMDVYWNSDTWRYEDHPVGQRSNYYGTAFQYQYMHLVADVQ